jgi:hypothetical protein
VPSAASPCPEKADLQAALRDAIDRLLSLNNRQLEAVIVGSSAEVNAIEGELRRERVVKDNLVKAYMNHVHEHGC